MNNELFPKANEMFFRELVFVKLTNIFNDLNMCSFDCLIVRTIDQIED